MNLQEICKDERFVRGELFASCRNRYLLTNKEYESVNWYDEFGVPIQINWTGFFITDFISDKWKFYQFIDGKMVEIELELDQDFINDPKNLAWIATGGSIPYKNNKKRFYRGDESPAYLDLAAKLEDDFSKCQCLNGTRGSFVDGTCEICGKILQKIKSLIMNPEDYKRLKNFYEEKTMQPVEAIRWMRENPDKVIVAVEDERVKLKSECFDCESSHFKDGLWGILIYYPLLGEKSWKPISHLSMDLIFFAYTYKELKE